MALLAFLQGSIQLVPDGTIFLHIALILLMIWVLNRTLFAPINRILAEREKKIGGQFGAGDDVLRQADQKLAAYESNIREARAEGYGIIEKTRAAALENRQQQIDRVKAEVEQMLANEKVSLQKQVSGARVELQSNAQILAERISSNVLQRTI